MLEIVPYPQNVGAHTKSGALGLSLFSLMVNPRLHSSGKRKMYLKTF